MKNAPSVGMTSVPSGESDTPDDPVSIVRTSAMAPALSPWFQLRANRASADVARSSNS